MRSFLRRCHVKISKLSMLLSLCLLFSCSHFDIKERDFSKLSKKSSSEQVTEVIKKENKKKIIKYKAVSVEIKPGEVVKLDLKNTPVLDQGKISCKTQEVPFIKIGEMLTFYVSESYFSNFEPFNCEYFSNDGQKIELAKFEVKSKKFPFEKLNVNKRKVFYSKKDLKRIIKEKKELDNIYNHGSKKPYFNKSFKAPLSSKITSIYGTKRLFNNNKKSQHLGTDYRARIGHPIRSSNSGMVVLSKNLFFSGNTVILDHGMGIFTLYGHLSKSIAKVGQFITKNGLLGAAGMTGRVTGPHLHWGVKVHGKWVDGDSLVNPLKR